MELIDWLIDWLVGWLNGFNGMSTRKGQSVPIAATDDQQDTMNNIWHDGIHTIKTTIIIHGTCCSLRLEASINKLNLIRSSRQLSLIVITKWSTLQENLRTGQRKYYYNWYTSHNAAAIILYISSHNSNSYHKGQTQKHEKSKRRHAQLQI